MPNYNYVNARIRTMKSQLLDAAAFEKMLAAESLDVVVGILRDTPYRPDLAEAVDMSAESKMETTGLEALERALVRNLSRTFRKLLHLLSDEEGESITLLTRRWDLENVKAIVRARHAGYGGHGGHGDYGGYGVEERLDLVPAGEIGPAALSEMAAAEDLRALAGLMATWNLDFARPLLKALPDYEATGDLAALEGALDRHYFTAALARLGTDENSRMLRAALAMEADALNIILALKILKKQVGAGGERTFLPGGSLSVRFLKRLLKARDMLDAVTILEDTRYAPAVEKGILHFGQSGQISIFERRLEGVIIRRTARQAVTEFHSIAPAIGYVWAKYNEFVNLRLIARCKAHGVPQGAIREELILV